MAEIFHETTIYSYILITYEIEKGISYIKHYVKLSHYSLLSNILFALLFVYLKIARTAVSNTSLTP